MSQVLLVPQDLPALQEQPREMGVMEGSPDPGVHKDQRGSQVHLEILEETGSL